WSGMVDIGSIKMLQTFEVFDANGVFYMLLGRPWLDATQAVQDFYDDTLTMHTDKGTVTLQNV
ncbi:hypothetical protein K439DRAFT_1346295, partial [Ramaria rubella]